MSSSTHQLDFCLVVSLKGGAQWLTPSQAKRLCEAYEPLWEVMDEIHPQFNAYAKQAGPKPVKFVNDSTKPGV